MSALFSVIIAFAPMRSADTLPPGRSGVYVSGGLVAVGARPVGLPALPLLLGDLDLGRGLTGAIDVRARYTTVMLLSHRVGGEVRGRVLRTERASLALRVYPSVALSTFAIRGFFYNVDVSTEAAALFTYRHGITALTAEAGATVRWLSVDGAGRALLDTRPHASFFTFALGAEWPTGPAVSLSLRAELGVVGAQADALSLFGLFFPRVLFGGSFGR